MMTLETKSEEEVNKEIAQIQKHLNYKPTKEECESYSKAHTREHRDRHFYLFKFNRNPFGLTTHTLASDKLYDSNILDIMTRSLKEGTFVSLEKTTIKEYAQNGGGDIPCCLKNCEYEGDWPPCMKKK